MVARIIQLVIGASVLIMAWSCVYEILLSVEVSEGVAFLVASFVSLLLALLVALILLWRNRIQECDESRALNQLPANRRFSGGMRGTVSQHGGRRGHLAPRLSPIEAPVQLMGDNSPARPEGARAEEKREASATGFVRPEFERSDEKCDNTRRKNQGEQPTAVQETSGEVVEEERPVKREEQNTFEAGEDDETIAHRIALLNSEQLQELVRRRRDDVFSLLQQVNQELSKVDSSLRKHMSSTTSGSIDGVIQVRRITTALEKRLIALEALIQQREAGDVNLVRELVFGNLCFEEDSLNSLITAQPLPPLKPSEWRPKLSELFLRICRRKEIFKDAKLTLPF